MHSEAMALLAPALAALSSCIQAMSARACFCRSSRPVLGTPWTRATGTKVPGSSASALLIEATTTSECAAKRHLVGVLQIAADG